MFPSTRWRLNILAAAVLGAAAAGAADAPPKPAGPDPATPAAPRPDPGKSPAVRGLDALNLPADAILVIAEEAKNALGLLPRVVVLTPEKYQALRDRLEQLERQLKPSRPDTPTSCKLTGRVEGDVVRFQVHFEFRTDRPRALVALGCQRAWPTGATLDGHLPLLISGEEGLVVQVDSPGVHQLMLGLELSLAARGAKGGERGFDFGLPRAAITALEQFNLPAQVAEVRVNGRALKTKAVDPQFSRLDPIPLGAAERLDVVWKGASPSPQKGPPLLAAEAQVAVRVDDARLTTEVKLSLETLRGETRQWRIQLPPQSFLEDIKEPRAEDDRIERIDLPDPRNPVLTIRLKEATAEPLRVVFQLRQPRPGARVPVGPFTVLDAFRQRGTIVIAAPPDLRLWYHPRPDVSQREIPEDLRRDNSVAAFTYWNSPASAATAPPLELEIEPAKGAIETEVTHELTLAPPAWKLLTHITVTPPLRPGIDRLEVQLPPGYPDLDKKASLSKVVEDVVIDAQRRVAQVKLFEKHTREFTVTLQTLYPIPPGAQQLSLELPSPVQTPETRDLGGKVVVTLPEGWELFAPESGLLPHSLPNGDRGGWRGVREHTWHSELAPSRIDLAWRPYGPELPVTGTAEVTLAAGHARIRQRLQFSFPKKAPEQVLLHLPESLADRVRLEGEGGALQPNEDKGKPSTFWASLASGPAGKKDTVTLLYSIPLREGADLPFTPAADEEGPDERPLTLPLVWPVQGSQVKMKVYVWSDPEMQPLLASNAWEELPPEVIADRTSLPNLVLSASGLDAPLRLTLHTPEGALLTAVAADRVLIQAATTPQGSQSYRARFRLTRLNSHYLEVELPASPSSSKLETILDARKVPWNPVAGRSTVARLRVEPVLYRLPAVLELRYEITPDHTTMNLRHAFYPPVLRSGDRAEVSLGQVRWRVALPPGSVPLYREAGSSSEQRWGWRGGLLTPRPAVTNADLERWLGLPPSPAASSVDKETDARPRETDSVVVCRRAALEPLHLIQAPEQAWLLVCSLLFLVIGLVLCFAPLPRALSWTLMAALGFAAAVAGLRWPAVASAVVYGCEPGLIVLGLVLAFQWLVYRRYRRQLVFLPGFTRLKAGSSLIRSASNNRPRAEPSTVDAPPLPQRESSVK